MKLIAFDIETWGLKEGYALQPWRSKTGEGGIICEKYYPEILAAPQLVFNNTDKIVFCGWNLKFDTAWFLARGQKLDKCLFLDGMLLLKRIFKKLPTYALKPTLERFKDEIDFTTCGIEYVSGYNSGVEFRAGALNEVYAPQELELMREYCERDTRYTYSLIKYLLTLADKNAVLQTIRESTVSVLFADSWQRGLPLDKENIELQKTDVLQKIKECEETLKQKGITEKIIRSSQQLNEFLQTRLSISLTERTQKGNYSVASPVLKDLAYKEHNETTKSLLQTIVKYKEYLTEHDKFIIPTLECVKESNIVHSEPFINSTETGRMTYEKQQTIKISKLTKKGSLKTTTSKINLGLPLHQMKRGKTRKMVIAPKGYKLLELDFAGQELRLIADIGNEPTMIKFLNEGLDLHAYTAAKIYGHTFENFQKLEGTQEYKEKRHLGKLTNFGLQYRAGAKRLHKEWHTKYGLVDKTIDDAIRARETYLNIYSGVPAYWRDTVNFARNNGYVENMAGRRRYIDKWSGDDERMSQQKAINFPIQSTGAEQTVLALFELRKFMAQENVLLAWALHDGMYFFVPDCDMTFDIADEMMNIASNLDYKKAWGWEPKVKFPVEAKIGDNWADLKPFC